MSQSLLITESEMKKWAKTFSKTLKPGMTILLFGEMGAGKTTLVRYIAEALGVLRVSSPTFTLVNVYDADFKLYHLDLYRMQTEADCYSIDIDRYLFPSDGVSLIEWPERMGALMPSLAVCLSLEYVDERLRKLTIK